MTVARSAGETGVRRRARPSRLAGVVWLAIGFGLFLDGFAVTVSWIDYGLGEWLWGLALVVPFVVFTIVLFGAQPSRRLREFTVAAVGLYPAIVYRMSSPLVLGGYDEHLHEQILLNLLRGSGFFAPNPILTVGPHYPGLELFTGLAVRLTSLPLMAGMSIVVLLCRLLLVLTIYHAALTVSESRRGASLAVVFYAVSPQFYFFNSQFAYQTMAVTLGLGGILLLRYAQFAPVRHSRRLWLLAVLALVATVVTHHVTSWIVLAFLILWAVASPRGQRRLVGRAAGLMAVAVGVWTAAIGPQLAGYLEPIFASASQEWHSFLSGQLQRAMFSADGATSAIPLWDRIVLVLYSLIILCAAVVSGRILLSKALRNRDWPIGLIGALSLIAPLCLAAHFVPAAAALGDRASTFAFFPLALSVSLVVRRHPRVSRRLVRYPGRPGLGRVVMLSGLTAVAYLGSVLLGSAPNWQRLPGPYLVSAEARTQDPETLAAVQWAASHIPAGSRVVADRVPAVLLAGKARLWPVHKPEDGMDPASLYFSDTWGPRQTAIVKGLHIQYLYVDQRLATSLWHVGFYIHPGETPTPERIRAPALAKFASVRGLTAVYHHGPVAIYDTSGLGVRAVRDGFTGQRQLGFGPTVNFLLGSGMVGVLLLLRRRLKWVMPTARRIGATGTGVAVMPIAIFISGVLFALRLTPGSAFTVGAVMTAVVMLLLLRHADVLGRTLRWFVPRRLDPVVLLGIVAGLTGLAIALHSAWVVDVRDVQQILSAVARANHS